MLPGQGGIVIEGASSKSDQCRALSEAVAHLRLHLICSAVTEQFAREIKIKFPHFERIAPLMAEKNVPRAERIKDGKSAQHSLISSTKTSHQKELAVLIASLRGSKHPIEEAQILSQGCLIGSSARRSRTREKKNAICTVL